MIRKELRNEKGSRCAEPAWLPGTTIEIEPTTLLSITEKICQQCRYPLLALRLLIYMICEMDSHGRISISARRLSKSLDVHYDTVTKCLKYLRDIGVLKIER